MTVVASDEAQYTPNPPGERRQTRDFIFPPIEWGRPDVLFTPAFWAHQVAICDSGIAQGKQGIHRLGRSFKEECVACMLGGYGIPAEVGVVAFRELVSSGVLDEEDATEAAVYDVVSKPLRLQDGRSVLYRFARQKSVYISEFLSNFTEPLPGTLPRTVRDWLTTFRGMGPKTASFLPVAVVRSGIP